MAAQANFSERFIRKTRLAANEYHKNFFKLDEEIITAITSAEADEVTPLMSKIYLRLVNAPGRYWEREGVLRFEAESREGKQVKAWDVLCEVAGVASATANKAVNWLHDSGIIGYFAGKNGVGLRIFLNRASASIGVRASSPGQKILHFPPASSDASHASTDEAAFKDSYADPEGSDSDLNPRAPSGADTKPDDKTDPDLTPTPAERIPTPTRREAGRLKYVPGQPTAVTVDEIIERLKGELEPCVNKAATRAAENAAARESARTREWFETRALPKAVRVAQHETYDLLKKLGQLDDRARRTRAGLEVGRAASDSHTPVAHKLTEEEMRETAETCVALFETQGKSIELTLSEISSEGGGWLLPEDAPRVREAALSLLDERREGR
jgi:hypothetical protein